MQQAVAENVPYILKGRAGSYQRHQETAPVVFRQLVEDAEYAEKAVSAVFDTIVEKVAEGEDVRIVGFGVFERHERKERIGSNPRTGDPITIPASNVPAFKAGKVFRNAVSEK